MKLTGKALNALENYIGIESGYIDINTNMGYDFDSTIINALIIEFFDSVEIYIEVLYFVDGNYFVSIVHHNDGYNHIGDFDSRTEAISTAIIKANIIYNENK